MRLELVSVVLSAWQQCSTKRCWLIQCFDAHEGNDSTSKSGMYIVYNK